MPEQPTGSTSPAPAPDEKATSPVIDWIDAVLCIAAIWLGVLAGDQLGLDTDGRVFKYGLAAVVIVVFIGRRAITGGPRVAAVRSGGGGLGVLALLLVIVGALTAGIAGHAFFSTLREEPTIGFDPAAARAKLDLPRFYPPGTTAEQRARLDEERRLEDLASDARMRAQLLAEAERDRRADLEREAKAAGIGLLLLAVGAALDTWRIRRYAA